jgi:hypothetical protein
MLRFYGGSARLSVIDNYLIMAMIPSQHFELLGVPITEHKMP